MAQRICLQCGESFEPVNTVQKTCGAICARERRRAQIRARYVPASPREPMPCEGCGKPVRLTVKAARMPKWCLDCRAIREDQRIRRRQAGIERCCYRCGRATPELAGKHGRAVCDGCRRTSTSHRAATLRTYGLTSEQYEAMVHAQRDPLGVVRCAICRTDVPGRGYEYFNIDHNHQTSEVRGLLCHGCNIGLGAFGHSIANLLKATMYLGLKPPSNLSWLEPESGLVIESCS